jgi:hypothetical protein
MRLSPVDDRYLVARYLAALVEVALDLAVDDTDAVARVRIILTGFVARPADTGDVDTGVCRRMLTQA